MILTLKKIKENAQNAKEKDVLMTDRFSGEPTEKYSPQVPTDPENQTELIELEQVLEILPFYAEAFRFLRYFHEKIPRNKYRELLESHIGMPLDSWENLACELQEFINLCVDSHNHAPEKFKDEE
jgi:hypothetical protein